MSGIEDSGNEQIHVSEIVGQPDENIIDAWVENQGGSFVLVTQYITNQEPQSGRDMSDPAEWTPKEAAFGHVRRESAGNENTGESRADQQTEARDD